MQGRAIKGERVLLLKSGFKVNLRDWPESSQNESVVRDNLESVSCFCIVTGLAQSPETRLSKNINERGFVGGDPLDRRQATGCPINAVRHTFLENKGDEAGQKALDKV